MTVKYRKDYIAPHYRLARTELDFTLHPTQTRVKARLSFENYDTSKELLLNGQYMELISLHMNGQEVLPQEYVKTPQSLTLFPKKEKFVLETVVEINPEANTRLMGLYLSDGIFCTQCEPEGFRNITYYPDHSDVPSHFTVAIHAERQKYPILLSNGNKIKDEGDTVVWEDPFNKPCYLFALVAGDLDSLQDTFTTRSGKQVDLHLYCERDKKGRLSFAMEALKRAMAWDERTFGLEYDLNLFNIVAVSHFNAGAMENKSLNIFNDSVLLASPDTATDAAYAHIDRVIAHEYFHNYSGDRVTLRDWFDLSLKEGFTVFRDQEYAYDVWSRAVGRLDNMMNLRRSQYPEDDGPLAHPVRPDSYQVVDNFYTATVYEKGAEVIRMQQALVGKEAFMAGCKLYFQRHDGQAVTIDEFVQAIQDASGVDLTAFKQWYSVAGRPKVSVATRFERGALTVRLKQAHAKTQNPFVIPLHYGLVGADGQDMRTGTLVLNQREQEFLFTGLPEKPVLSLNRFFTAPVDLEPDYTDAERLHLMKYDSDLVNRYDVGYQYALEALSEMASRPDSQPRQAVIEAMGSYWAQADLDRAFLARAIAFPAVSDIFEHVSVADVALIRRAREEMRQAFAATYAEELLKRYHENQIAGDYRVTAEDMGRRALKNAALSYLALTPHNALVWQQYQEANNLTDRLAALSILTHDGLPEAEQALDDFYQRYESESLVLDRWFSVQALSPAEKTLMTVKNLTQHPKFDYKNPNKVRALLGAFTGNPIAFHQPDGAGYRFIVEQCALIDKLNPSIAARLLAQFSHTRKVKPELRQKALEALQFLLKQEGLSENARETLDRLLNA